MVVLSGNLKFCMVIIRTISIVQKFFIATATQIEKLTFLTPIYSSWPCPMIEPNTVTHGCICSVSIQSTVQTTEAVPYCPANTPLPLMYKTPSHFQLKFLHMYSSLANKPLLLAINLAIFVS